VTASVITNVFLKAKWLSNIPAGTFVTSEGEYAENAQNNGEKELFDSE
jgi:hypothetical protein